MSDGTDSLIGSLIGVIRTRLAEMETDLARSVMEAETDADRAVDDGGPGQAFARGRAQGLREAQARTRRIIARIT